MIPLKDIVQGGPLPFSSFVGQDIAILDLEAFIDFDHALQGRLPLLVIFLLDGCYSLQWSAV